MRIPRCPICESKGSLHKKWVFNKLKKRYEPYFYMAHYNAETKRIRWCYVDRKTAAELIHRFT